MAFIRWVLGRIILAIDWLTRPKKPDHDSAVQAELDRATANMALYQFRACPFCVRTRRTARRLGLNIETRDARNDPVWKQELIREGGAYQVPCLRVDEVGGRVKWIYESKEIDRYLQQRFARNR